MDRNEILESNEYPVDIVEGVAFLGDGVQIPNLCEIFAGCSNSLYKMAEENQELKEFLISCKDRYLAGDMGEGDEAYTRRNIVYFHEGLPAYGYYETELVEEGAIIMGFTEELCYCFDDIPRNFIALLPSEDELLYEWFERHPDKRAADKTTPDAQPEEDASFGSILERLESGEEITDEEWDIIHEHDIAETHKKLLDAGYDEEFIAEFIELINRFADSYDDLDLDVSDQS